MKILGKLALALAAIAVSACDKNDRYTRHFDEQCLNESVGNYPDQETSDYAIPWLPGETYSVGQGNCTTFSHSGVQQRYAYDFLMPIGTTIVAARSGFVSAVASHFPDNTGTPREENYLIIEHDDGTAARYVHLTTDGILREVGEFVDQGEPIAISGNTGNSTEPHLHFDVLNTACLPHEDFHCRAIPINFRNTSPHENGLIEGEIYTAF